MRSSSCPSLARCSIVASAAANRFIRRQRGYVLQVNQPAQLPQARKGEPRRSPHGQRRRLDLGHPRGQQQSAPVWQFDDKVHIAAVLETPNDPWIPERSATRLREADLNVFSKLGNQGLEGRLEPEAFTGREVRREDDLLDFLVGYPVDIEMARQPST